MWGLHVVNKIVCLYRNMGDKHQFFGKGQLENGISLLAILYSAIPLGIFLFHPSHNFQHTLWFLAVLSASSVASLIKLATQWLGLPYWCERPRGARDCDMWNSNGPQTGAPGFPSGHVATAAAFWTGAILLTPTRYATLVWIGATVGIVAMAWARMEKRCHTLLQTIGGSLLGAVLSYSVLQYNPNKTLL